MTISQIFIDGISAFGYHGVFDYEKTDGQEFIVDIAMQVDISDAVETDDILRTVDYGKVVDSVVDSITKQRFDLIESLAHFIATEVLVMQGVQQVTVTVHKPHAPIQHKFVDVRVQVTLP